MAHVERDGVRIAYEAHGNGPPLLLSHGFSASKEMWRPQLEALGQRYRVMAWDMRGHGRSDSPEDPSVYSEEETIEDMRAVLEACGAERAVLGGLSLGGFMSLAFYRVYPDRVAGLMLFCTGPGYRSDEARAKWNEMADGYARRLERRGLDGLAPGDETQGAPHRSAEGLVRAARGMLAQRDARVIDSLPDIAVPTLVLVGEDDRDFHAPTDYMAKKIPGAKKVGIPEAGHAANLHQPAAFNRAVLDFLADVRW
jgi:pimeloyl-ACP methyl ester carboxylesterase